ncbi:hypothetical protein FACS1894191_2410 [Clostridia bacterium]|nr:hypothetical protein FACS1894191_2410 [Clostridia bacterium]
MMEPKHRILIVDDETMNRKVLNQILSAEYIVLIASSGEEALEVAAEEKPDIILLDIVLPNMSGFDVLRALKNRPDTSHIPVMFITGLTSEEDEEKGLSLGAADYITKPFRNAIVRARVKTQLQNAVQKRELERISMIDPLTNIPNRRNFDTHFESLWAHSIREKLPVSMLMMDIDKFKAYNDTYGHPQGDALLKAVAAVLSSVVKRTVDISARIGGEEFAVLLSNTGLDGAIMIAEKIRGCVEKTVVNTVGGKPTSTTVSIGAVSILPTSHDTIAAFFAKADACLYTAKATGRNKVYSEG